MYIYTYVDMGTKTISIMDDAYDLLIGMKMPGESFSDEIRRLTKTKSSVMDFAGAWKDISDKEAEKMKKTITEMRKSSRIDEVIKRMK